MPKHLQKKRKSYISVLSQCTFSMCVYIC
uniref:Uncharacterized protein n=1 Tax=Anguilla anguilla TaxID=7936 RepID=A0A0E9PGZ1_ANGAN